MSNTPIFNRIYDLDYFSDTSMFLYIGDVWIDEITSLRYVCRQDKTPIYGYASQLFDTTAAGHVIVQGSFTINFKEQGYLWAVLRRYFEMGPSAPEFVAKGKLDPASKKKAKQLISNKLGSSGGKGGRPVLGSNGTFMSKGTIERLASGGATKSELNQFYHYLSGYSTFNVGSPKDKVFEDICEAFEDQVWKETDNDSLLNQIRRTDDNAFDDFDIFVSHGDQSTKTANHTVQKIVGVRLLSQGKEIFVGQTQCTQEEYQFIARTVV